MTEISTDLKNYFLGNTRSYYQTYRNRAQLESFDYMVPCFQPDIILAGIDDAAIYRALCMTYESFPNGWKGDIHNMFRHAKEATPSYILINTYGVQDTEAAIENILEQLKIMEELEEDEPFTDAELEGLLILTPGHHVKLYYYKNVFVLFTNTLRRELMYKLNTAIFYVRAEITKDFTVLNSLENVPEFQEICDTYVEQMSTQNVFSTFADIYIKLYDLRIAKAEMLEAEKALKAMQGLIANLRKPLYTLNTENEKRSKIETEEQITELERRLTGLYALLRRYNLSCSGLLQESAALEESIEQFQTLLKEETASGELTNMKVSCPHKGWTEELDSTDSFEAFGFQTTGVLKFWNEDEAQMYIDNPSSCLHAYTILTQDLFQKIFIDKTVKLKVYMQFFLQKEYRGAGWNPPHKSQDLFQCSNKKGCPHPHIMRYDCWGDNAAPIVEALTNNDYSTAYLMCKQVLYSIAMSDSAVVEGLLDYMQDSYGDANAKWYIYKGKEYTGKEMRHVIAKEQKAEIEKLAKRTAAKKEVEENEDSENDGSN